MTSPKLEDEGILREWAPLSKFLQQIPMRLRHGLFFEDVKFTCVDATIECIVLGTNCGVVFWYDRSSHYVQQLRLEKSTNCITNVKVVSTVDFMVAAGDSSGVVTIFKIPKNIDGAHTFLPNLAEKIERYTVDGLHKSKITAFDWSINGQKLFSGDSEGIVVFTEMDFILNLSKAREIINEKYPIVQLSYCQRLQVLLISSEFRCIIWRNQSSGSNVTQIGQRERSSLLPLGGTFFCDTSGDISIFSCRGGLKLWKADLDGNVKFTFLFKEPLKKCNNTVKLLKPLEFLEISQPVEFGKLFPWRDGLFVSYTKHSLVVIDPMQVAVVSALLNTKDIAYLATTRTELFLIAGKRDLIRLGYTPDLCDSSVGGLGNMAQAESVSGIPEVSLTPIIGSPLSTSYTWNSYLSASTANSEPSSSEVNYGTDPAALPPVVSVFDGVPELRVEPSRYQQYTNIGQQGFDDIIYSQNRPQKHKNRRKSAEYSEAKSKNIGITFNGVASYINNIGKFLNGEFSPSICDGELENFEASLPVDILPDMRNIDAIVEDVQRKEVLLDALLDSFTEESNDCSADPDTNKDPLPQSHDDLIEKENDIKTPECSVLLDEPIKKEDLENSLLETHSNEMTSESQDSVTNLVSTQIENNEVENNNDIFMNSDELSESEINMECNRQEAESIPSESSKVDAPLDESSHYVCDSPLWTENEENSSQESSPTTFPLVIKESDFYTGWSSMTCPESPICISSWKNGLIMCSSPLKVYCQNENSWSSLDYKAENVIASTSGLMGLKIHCSLAHYSGKWLEGRDWTKIGKEVQHAAVLDDKIWFISHGDLFFTDLNSGKIVNHLNQTSLSKVYLYKKSLLFLTQNGRIVMFNHENWKLIRGIKNAKHLAVGPQNLIWVVDSKNLLYVTDNINVEKPLWWQVPIGDAKDSEIVSLCSSDDRIYLAFKRTALILFNKTYVTGHRWVPASLKFECTQIAAGGVFEEKGCIWIVDKKNKLIALDNTFNVVKEVPPPCNVVCIASTPSALWLLGDDGGVHLRKEMTDANPVGLHWRKLNLEQLHSQIEIVWISCGPDVVWACDIRGKVIMLVGSPHSIANDTVEPAWVPVDGRPIGSNTFTKVYVGPDTYMVWALDSGGNIYAREAVFPTYPLGTGWVHVPDMKASHLTISSEAVYALNRDGVFKRIGISQSNYVGDAWLHLPISLDYIAASFDLGLFGICSKTRTLIAHIERQFAISEHITVEKDWALL